MELERVASTCMPPPSLSLQALLSLFHTSLVSNIHPAQPPWSLRELTNLFHKSVLKAGCLQRILEKHMKPETQSDRENELPDSHSQWYLPLEHGRFRAANILRANGETVRVYWIERQRSEISDGLRGNASQTTNGSKKLKAKGPEYPLATCGVDEKQSIPTTPVTKMARPQSNSNSKSARVPFRSPMINRLNAEGGQDRSQSSPKGARGGTSNLSATSPMSRKLFSSPVRSIGPENAKSKHSHFTPFKSPMRVNQKEANILKEVDLQTSPRASQTYIFASDTGVAKAMETKQISGSFSQSVCEHASSSTDRNTIPLSIPALKLRKRELEKKIKKKEDKLSRLDFGRSVLRNNNTTTFEALINKWRTAAQATAERLFEKVEPAMRSTVQLQESGMMNSGFPGWGYDDDDEVSKRRRIDPEQYHQNEEGMDESSVGYEANRPIEDKEVSIAAMLTKMGVDLKLIRYDPEEESFQTGG